MYSYTITVFQVLQHSGAERDIYMSLDVTIYKSVAAQLQHFSGWTTVVDTDSIQGLLQLLFKEYPYWRQGIKSGKKLKGLQRLQAIPLILQYGIILVMRN